MAPPTVCIVALVLLQAGILEIIRPSIEVVSSCQRGSGSAT